MFRNVPACSGMFLVPGFIDGHVEDEDAMFKHFSLKLLSP